jgi:pimeloyl-ACP methyl ester carboxylesterase
MDLIGTRISRRHLLLSAGALGCASTVAGCTKPASTQVFKVASDRARYETLLRRVLAQWGTPYERLYLTTPHGRTHVIASGPKDAPPVVLLPALMAGAAIWWPNVAALSTVHRVYAVDTLGEPNLSEPVKPLKTRQDAAEWLSDLVGALGVRQADLVGNSFGGYLALNEAILSPERVRRLVMISPFGIAPLTSGFYLHFAKGLVAGQKAMGQWILNGVKPNPLNAAYGDLNSFGASHGRMINARMLPSPAAGELRKVRAPSLLLVGDREVVFDQKKLLGLARQCIPGVRAEVVPGANHMAAFSQPDAVNRLLMGFLA